MSDAIPAAGLAAVVPDAPAAPVAQTITTTPPVTPTPAPVIPVAAPVVAPKPVAAPATALTTDQLNAMLQKAISDALSFHQASLDSAAIVNAPPKSLVNIAWVPDVSSVLSWAETRISIVAVAVCGLVPVVVDQWHAAPPAVQEFVQHYLPSGSGAVIATALFALQTLATMMNFKAGSKP